MWLKKLLNKLRVKFLHPPRIFCDNIGATYLSANLVFYSRMKHIAIDHHFVRDHVARGHFLVAHISSKDQLANDLTKPLPAPMFQQLRSKIGVSDGSTVLRGLTVNNR